MTIDRATFTKAEQAAVAEETLSVLRHDVRNKLAAARQAGFYLKTKSQKSELWTSDPRFEKFFGIIDEQLALAERMLVDHEAIMSLYVRSPAPIEPSAVVAEAIAAAGPDAPARVEARDMPSARVLADAAELVLALRCLLENALAVTPERDHVGVAGEVRGEHYVLTVSDGGSGVSDEDFRRFLRPFETTRDGARGIGLSIAKRVASRYGGGVKLAAEQPARGAAIELSVALAKGGAP